MTTPLDPESRPNLRNGLICCLIFTTVHPHRFFQASFGSVPCVQSMFKLRGRNRRCSFSFQGAVRCSVPSNAATLLYVRQVTCNVVDNSSFDTTLDCTRAPHNTSSSKKVWGKQTYLGIYLSKNASKMWLETTAVAANVTHRSPPTAVTIDILSPHSSIHWKRHPQVRS